MIEYRGQDPDHTELSGTSLDLSHHYIQSADYDVAWHKYRAF